jgi:hypothetical protein
MIDWSLEIYQNQIKSKDLVENFSRSFPQRSKLFFEGAIELLDGANAKLFLLIVEGEVKGAAFGFKISGYDFDVWAPSYLYVEKEYRNISLLFIISVLKKMSNNIIDVSPTNDVRKILRAVKYKELSKGSVMIPVCFGVINIFSKQRLVMCSSPLLKFIERKDLIWLKLDNEEIFFCVKITSRYGMPFFILVYSDTKNFDIYISDILRKILKTYIIGILVIPNFEQKFRFPSLRSNKFYSLSNVDNFGDTYSILGSEVTELI